LYLRKARDIKMALRNLARPFYNFQFSIFNFQFSILNSPVEFQEAAGSAEGGLLAGKDFLLIFLQKGRYFGVVVEAVL